MFMSPKTGLHHTLFGRKYPPVLSGPSSFIMTCVGPFNKAILTLFVWWFTKEQCNWQVKQLPLSERITIE